MLYVAVYDIPARVTFTSDKCITKPASVTKYSVQFASPVRRILSVFLWHKLIVINCVWCMLLMCVVTCCLMPRVSMIMTVMIIHIRSKQTTTGENSRFV